MITPEPLARATLDTLPINVAVLDEEGTILYTNRAWREFGGREGLDDATMTGENYFAAADTDADVYARQAIAGIESVIAGEREFFRLEYPCHSDEERRWFVMRVAPLPETDEGSVVVAHVNVTQRKLAELSAEQRAEELHAERERIAGLLERIEGLVADVTTAVVEADTRTDVERAAPRQFVTVDQYRTAWTGRTDLRDETVSAVAAAGTGADEIETGASVPLGSRSEPTGEAVRSRRLVTEPLDSLPESSIHRAVGRDAEAVAALPLAYNDAVYGVLHLYAERAVFDERERTVLTALGRVLSTAINAVESRRMLAADDGVELEIAVSDPGVYPAALSATADCRLEYEGAVTRDDGAVLQFFAVADADPETVRAAADEQGVEATKLAVFDDADRYEFAVPDSPLVSLLADHGAEMHGLVAEDGRARLTLDLPSEADARDLFDRLEESFADVDLLAHRDRDSPVTTRREFERDLRDRLTDRQLTALQKAYVGGFFDWPRTISGEDLAETMDISPSTYHQHLRVAEHKLLDSLFGD